MFHHLFFRKHAELLLEIKIKVITIFIITLKKYLMGPGG